MSDRFYKAVRAIGSTAFWVSSSPVVTGTEQVPTEGPCILACNHTSPYDIAILIRHLKRPIDFVSITEVFRNPLVAWFYGSLNAFPLERSRPDAPTVRIILDRLEHGRLVGMFPEGGFRRDRHSVLHGGRIVSGIGRIARLTRAPVVPAVIVNSRAYSRVAAWFPLRATVYGAAFGTPIPPDAEPDEIERQLIAAMRGLHAALMAQLPEWLREEEIVAPATAAAEPGPPPHQDLRK
jgi:1-acyl-sn-glycerol-3-phosphate acyltransferase